MLIQVLFLGSPISGVIARAYMDNFQVASFFIGVEKNSLNEIEFQGVRYLGKFLGTKADLDRIELLEANIYSILKKINSDISCQAVPLVLLTTYSEAVEDHE